MSGEDIMGRVRLCVHFYDHNHMYTPPSTRLPEIRYRILLNEVFYDNGSFDLDPDDGVHQRKEEAVEIKGEIIDTKKELLNISSQCSICHDKFDAEATTVMELDCKHIFHTHCIEEWSHYASYCPICKTDFSI